MKKRKKRTGRWIFLIILFSLIGTVGLVAWYLIDQQDIVIEDNVLVVQLAGEIPEIAPSGISEILGEKQTLFRQLIQAIGNAKNNDSVKAIFLDVRSVRLGLARTQELREALMDFKESGKPIYAYFEMAEMGEYYLVSVADHIYMTPEGMLFMGMMSEVPFINGTLEKLKIQPDFLWQGKYKSGPEMFTRKSMSDPHREEMESLLKSLSDTMTKEICASRNIDFSAFQEVLDQSFINTQQAEKYKLVDNHLYPDELAEKIVDDLNLSDFAKTYPHSHVKRDGFASFTSKPKIAVVYAIGAIVPGSSQYEGAFGTYVGSDTVWRQMEDIRKDDSIKAVVLRVDSPGGSGTASDIIWRAVLKTKETKPVVVSMSNYAASGGYYISMGADHIVAEPNTLTGSIGVYSGKFNMHDFYNWIGITKDQIKIGEQADFFSSYGSFSDEQREILTSWLEKFYKTFVTKAAEGRHVTYEELHSVAQGRVWTGQQALANGLVDSLGGLREALDVAKSLSGIPVQKKVSLVLYPGKRSILDTFKKDTGKFDLKIPTELQQILCEREMMERMQEEKVFALSPEVWSMYRNGIQ